MKRLRDEAGEELAETKRSPIDSLISCFELIKTNTRRTRSTILPAGLSRSENISNEQTVRFEPL